MGDKILLTDEREVRLEGYFNISETYSDVRSYLEKARHYDMAENNFTEKNDGNKRYLFTIMMGEFYYSDYMAINIPIKMELSGEEVEVEIDGKKQVLVKGFARLILAGYGNADYMEKRKLSPFMTFVNKMSDKFYGKNLMKKLKTKAVSDMEGLVEIFKKNMRTRVQ